MIEIEIAAPVRNDGFAIQLNVGCVVSQGSCPSGCGTAKHNLSTTPVSVLFLYISYDISIKERKHRVML